MLSAILLSALLFSKRINLNFFMFLKKDDMALTGQFFISPSVFAVRIICANNSLGDGSDPRASRRCACVLKIQRKTFVQSVVGIPYFVHSFSELSSLDAYQFNFYLQQFF